MAERTATVTWSGSLGEGRGELSLQSSNVLVSSPVTWQARVEEADGRTSPEELLAGAHATCYAMSLTVTLGQQGYRPEEIEVRATCSFGQAGEGFAVTGMKLSARARVPDIDEAAFQQAVQAAELGCPISNAIRGNVDVDLEASLE